MAPRLALSTRRDLFPYMLALPIIIYEGIFILFPILQQIGSSFTSDIVMGSGERAIEATQSEPYLPLNELGGTKDEGNKYDECLACQ